jgi:hypothetical protein
VAAGYAWRVCALPADTAMERPHGCSPQWRSTYSLSQRPEESSPLAAERPRNESPALQLAVAEAHPPEQPASHAQEQRACPYCLVGAALNFSMLPLVAGEALSSAQALLGRPTGRLSARGA